jgi:hypothetical protein
MQNPQSYGKKLMSPALNKKVVASITVILSCCASIVIAAQHLPYNTPLISPALTKAFQLRPVLRVWGTTGNRSMGTGQMLVPLYGNQNHVLYAIAEGNKGISDEKNWYGGAGLGYRKIINNRIYGGYLIGNYNHSSTTGHGYTIINPGLEILGPHWDFIINGYLPIGTQKINYTESGWADRFGVTDYVKYIGHKKFNRTASQDNIEFVGKGLDLRIGRVIPHIEKAKVYLGGYYFNMGDAGNMTGGLLKAAYEINKYAAIEFTQTYDQKNHSRTSVGVRLAFGGYDTQQDLKNFGMASRLLDPIERGYSQTLTPFASKYGAVNPTSELMLELDNLWWHFPPLLNKIRLGYSGSGTYEDPFIGFDSTTVDTIKNSGYVPDPRFPYPTLMFKSGTYALTDFSDNTFSIPYGWGMRGVDSDDPRKPAFGDKRPTFRGSLQIDPSANSDGRAGNNIIDSIILKNISSSVSQTTTKPIKTSKISSEGNPAGLIINNATTANPITLRNVQIGADNADDGYYAGIAISNSTLNFEKLDYVEDGVNRVYAYCTDSGCFVDGGDYVASGIFISGSNTTINFNSGENFIIGTMNNASLTSRYIFGIYSQEATTNNVINFNSGSNTIRGVDSSTTNGGYAVAMEIGGENTININNGTNLFTASSSFAAYTIDLYSGNNNSNLYIKGGINTFEAVSSINGTNQQNIQPIYAEGLNNFIISGGINLFKASTNDLSTTDAYATGIEMQNITNAKITGGINTIDATAEGVNRAQGTGILLGNTKLSISGGINTINVFALVSSSPTTTPTSHGIDIYGDTADSALVEFLNGSTTTINASANSTSATQAYGIYTQDLAFSTIKFLGGSVGINLDNTGSDAINMYGMKLSQNTKVYDTTHELASTDDIDDIGSLTITKNGADTGPGNSAKISWSNHGDDIQWPPLRTHYNNQKPK